MGGVKDPLLWQAVQAEKRFLVTADKGFADIRYYAPGSHAGVLLLRPDQDGVRPVIELLRRVLAWYFESVSLVNVVYGSIGAVVVVLLLMEIGALVILLGAQVIAEYERFVYREKFLAPRAGSPRNSRLESGVIGTVGGFRNGLSEMRPRDGTGQLPGHRS
jgi:hypothetical protein